MLQKLSIVVPVYNEAAGLKELHAEIVAALTPPTVPSYEIIYVNDGSRDTSLQVLRSLSPKPHIIDLNRNYGQSTALDAGFRAATGDIVVTLDGDGQNDPADIPLLLSTLEEKNLDVVAGWRKHRKDKGGIRILTRIGRFMRSFILEDKVHDTGCTLRAYRAEAAHSLDLQGEMHRYILALLRWKGFSIGEVVVHHRPRKHGKSNYGYSKAIRGFLDLTYIWFIHKYSQRPLHLFGYLSLGTFALSGLSLLWTLYGKAFLGLSLNRNGWFFLTFFFALAGIMLLSFGIIIDLLIRIYHNTSPQEKRYYVRPSSSFSEQPTPTPVRVVHADRKQKT